MWEKAGETINEQPQGTVNGLVEGNEYQFRVIAVNKSGQSEPSRPCANFIAKPRYRKSSNYRYNKFTTSSNNTVRPSSV